MVFWKYFSHVPFFFLRNLMLAFHRFELAVLFAGYPALTVSLPTDIEIIIKIQVLRLSSILRGDQETVPHGTDQPALSPGYGR